METTTTIQTSNDCRINFVFLVIMMMEARSAPAQQQIDSKGNNNTNTNIGTFNVIVPTVSRETKIIIRERLKVTHPKISMNSDEWEGTLLPANEPVASRCFPIRPKELCLSVGGNLFACTSQNCNVVRTNDKELIWVAKKNDVLQVNARVLQPDGTIIASIENGRFYVNRNQTYRTPDRPDASTLVVFDQKGTPVLRLHYANKNVLLVEGVFNAPKNHTVTVRRDKISTNEESGDSIMGKNCFVDGSDGAQVNDYIFGGPFQSTDESNHS